MSTVQRNEQELIKIEKLHELRSLGINPYPVSYDRTHHATEILESFTDEQPEALNSVRVAGRIMAIRKMGKASFCHI